jgi:alanine dehydrogenase
MINGTPQEVKSGEGRVAAVPAGVQQLERSGHRVLIERGADVGSGIPDPDYAAYGAELVSSAAEPWERAKWACKVKEPLAEEFPPIRPKPVVFTCFHFAASHKLTEGVRDSGCIAIAYETIVDAHGRLPPGSGGVRFSV